jgi:hypothetical protein
MTAHDDRVAALKAAYLKAKNDMIRRLEGLDDAAASKGTSDGGWSAAQIGAHVALTTEFLSGVLAGKVAEMDTPRPGDFIEQMMQMDWSGKFQTYPMLEPGNVSRQDAVAKLRASAQVFNGALQAAAPARYDSTVIKMPFGVVFSVYEVGEFVGAHLTRHAGQMKRALTA